MNKDQITALACKHGTNYTSGPFINWLFLAFGNEAWAAFCEALVAAQPVQQSVQPMAVISGAFGGRPCIRVLDTAAIYPDGTALYTSPPIAQPVQPVEVQQEMSTIEILSKAASIGGLFDELALNYQTSDILKFAEALGIKPGSEGGAA